MPLAGDGRTENTVCVATKCLLWNLHTASLEWVKRQSILFILIVDNLEGSVTAKRGCWCCSKALSVLCRNIGGVASLIPSTKMHVYSLPKTMGIYACLLLKILYAIKCLILPILWPLPANLHSRQITVTIQFLCTGRCVANIFWMVSRVLIY